MPRERKYAAQLAPIVPAPITATCFTMWFPSYPSEKCLDLPARQHRLLVMHEMRSLRRDRNLNIAEKLVEPVGPFAPEHGITGTPEHACRYGDRQPAALRRLAADHREPGLMHADVPVETTLEVTGLHEIVDPGLEVLVEGMGIMGPVPEEMPDIGPARLARAANQRRGPRLLMERLVPYLREMVRRCPTRTNPRIGTVEEEQSVEPIRMIVRDRLRDMGADIVRDDADSLEAEPVHQRQDIRRMDVGPGIRRRPVHGLLRVTEATQVRRDHVKLDTKPRDAFPPDTAKFRPAVEQQQGRPPTLPQIVNADAVRADVVRLEPGHAAFSREARASAISGSGVTRPRARGPDPRSGPRNPLGRPIAAPAPRRCPASTFPPARASDAWWSRGG